MPNPKKTLTTILIVLIIISLIAVLYPFISNPTSISEAYATAGIFAPIVFIVLVMVAPTPGAVVGASGGAYFGIWEGALYLFIGNLLGVCITFLLVQRFGLPAAKRFFKEEKLIAYEEFASKHPFLQWIVYALPIFPIELMTFVVALSGKKFRKFFLTVITALPLYAILVTWIGYNVSSHFQKAFEYASLVVLIVIAYAILHFLYAWKREEIHQAGRTMRSHMARGVGEFEEATGRVAKKVQDSVVKPAQNFARRRKK